MSISSICSHTQPLEMDRNHFSYLRQKCVYFRGFWNGKTDSSRHHSIKWPGFFFKSIFLKNFFGFVITISNGNEKKMKVAYLRLDPVQPTPTNSKSDFISLHYVAGIFLSRQYFTMSFVKGKKTLSKALKCYLPVASH